MISLLDVDALGLPTILLPPTEGGPQGSSCQRCEAFRPAPQLSGNLQVDPEIHLPSPGLDVDIAYYYNSATPSGAPFQNGPYGYNRSISPAQVAQLYGASMSQLIMQRGNGAVVTFLDDGTGTGTFKAGTPGILSHVVTDTTNNLLKEITPSGEISAYPRDLSGNPTNITYREDAVGNRHTYSYSSGVLSTIQDAVGRLVTFHYASGLLQSIQDWADRRTTFQYDTTTASPRKLLTTIIGPTGCQTGYQYGLVGVSPNQDWLLTGIVDPNGFGTSYTFDSQKRTTTRTIAGAGTTSYTYGTNNVQSVDALGNVTTQTTDANNQMMGGQNALGAFITYTRNAHNQVTGFVSPIGAVTTSAYDANGNMTSTTTPLGDTTTATFDAYNNLTSVQTADGAIVTNIWGYPGSSFDTTGAKRRLQAQVNQLGFITSYGYNSRGQMVSVQTPLGFLTTTGYDTFGNPTTQQDALGNISTSVFDLAGNVIASINPLGATWTTTFDNQNRPLTQQNPLGFISTVGYDSVGNRVVEINPLGYRTTTSFNVFDKPVAQVDALGNVRTTIYDNLGRALAFVDPLGSRSTAVFDSLGRMVASVDPLGNVSTSVFDNVNRQIAQMDPIGNCTTTIFDFADRVIASVDALGNYSTTIFDNLNRPIASQNALGYLSTDVFDLAGRQIARVDALGSRYSTVFDSAGRAVASVDPLGRTNTTVFDPMSRRIASIDARGFYSTTNFDAAGRAVSRQDALNRLSTTIFDSANRAIAWIDALGNRNTTSLDMAGRTISTMDPLNRISTTVFDPLNRPIASISPLGFCQTTNFDADGRTLSLQNALGQLSTHVFDAASRQIASISPLGYRSSTIYDNASRPIASQDALGFFWTRVLDADGRTIASVDPLGNRNSTVFDAVGQTRGQVDAVGNRSSTVFDPLGRILAQQDARNYRTSFVFDVAGQQIAVVTANGGITTSLFDQRGAMYASQDPLGAFTSYQFDAVGNKILRMDARNWPTSYTRDPLNRTVGTLYRDGTRVTSTFDNAGQQLTAQDVTGITSFAFDLDGRKVGVVYPAGNTLTYSLDPVGNRVLLIDPDAGLTTYSWDSQNRLVGIANPFAERTTIQYDALDREQHRVLGNGMNVSHLFDAAGRETLLGNYDLFGTALAVFTNTYDTVGNRLSVLELDGSQVTYAYDASYQLVNEQRSGATPYNTTYTYDGMGNRLVQNDTGVLTTSTYNAANELLSSQQTVSSQFYQINCGGAVASPFQADAYYQVIDSNTGTFSHTIDLSGVVDPAPMSVYQSLRFDKFFYTLPNLTPGATYKVRLHFAECYFSSVGQRVFDVILNGTTVLPSFDIVAAAGAANKAVIEEFTTIADGSGQITVSFRAITDLPQINGIEVLVGAGMINYAHDPSGNLLTTTDWTGVTTYTWDSENRLLSVANPLNGSETYTYASNGIRKRKETPTQTINFVWDEQNVLQERSVSNVRLAQYTDFPEEWGGLASARQGTTSSFYGSDSQGSTRILVKIGSTIVDSYVYKAFGLELAPSPTPQAEYTTNPYRYGGQYGYYRDNISRLYIRARHLWTSAGIWFSRDPVQFSGGDWNLYRYCFNEGVNALDPSGLMPDFYLPTWPIIPIPIKFPSLHQGSPVVPILPNLPPPGQPCRFDWVPTFCSLPCVDITAGYANDYDSNHNELSRCASCVSAALCRALYAGTAFGVAGIAMLQLPVVRAMQCQNLCMYDYYMRKDLPEWKDSKNKCLENPRSYECCTATVKAEQAGYTACYNRCGLPRVPKNLREALAIDVLHCCGSPSMQRPR